MTETANYPVGWTPAEQYHPEQHFSKARSSSKEPDYLNVAQRLVWFVTEQRQMIAAGVATRPYVVQTEAVEINIQAGYAVFKTFIRDVLGNEATDYGTESRADFGDFVEKAATKSRGRALLNLGYGTNFAPELDEGERIVDTPRRPAQEQRQAVQQPRTAAQRPTPPPAAKPAPTDPRAQLRQMAGTLGYDDESFNDLLQQYTYDGRVDLSQVRAHLEKEGAQAPADPNEPHANEQQLQSLHKLALALGHEEPAPNTLTFNGAAALLRTWSKEYNTQRRSA